MDSLSASIRRGGTVHRRDSDESEQYYMRLATRSSARVLRSRRIPDQRSTRKRCPRFVDRTLDVVSEYDLGRDHLACCSGMLFYSRPVECPSCRILLQNVDILKDAEVVKNLANILKTNVAACKSIGSPFLSQVSVLLLS